MAREQLIREVNIVEIVKSRRIIKAALKSLISAEKLDDIFDDVQ